MFNLSTGIVSLTKFKRETADFLARLRSTGEPVVFDSQWQGRNGGPGSVRLSKAG